MPAVVLEVKNRGASNLYHWFIYMFVNFKAMVPYDKTDRHIIFKDFDPTCTFQPDSLNVLFYPDHIHTSWDKFKQFLPDTPYIILQPADWSLGDSSLSDHQLEGYRFLRSLFPPPATLGDKITYISRNDNHKAGTHLNISVRTVSNEADLVARIGADCYLFHDIDFATQLSIIQQSKILISPHGAGLTHMLFVHPDCLIIELTPERTDNCRHFTFIAKLLKLKYFHLWCPWTGNLVMTADIERIVELLDQS